MELNTRNQEYNKMMKQFEAPNPNEVFKDDEVDEVSNDKNAPLTDKKGGKMIKRDNVIIPKESNNINVLANKRENKQIDDLITPFKFSNITLCEYCEAVYNHIVANYRQIELKALQNFSFLMAYGGFDIDPFYVLDLSLSGIGKTANQTTQQYLLLDPVKDRQMEKHDTFKADENNKGKKAFFNNIHEDLSKGGIEASFSFEKVQMIEIDEYARVAKDPVAKPLFTSILKQHGKKDFSIPTYKSNEADYKPIIKGAKLYTCFSTTIDTLTIKGYKEEIQTGDLNRPITVFTDKRLRGKKHLDISKSIKEKYYNYANDLIEFSNKFKDFKFEENNIQKNPIYDEFINWKYKREEALSDELRVLYARAEQNFKAIAQTLHLLKEFERYRQNGFNFEISKRVDDDLLYETFDFLVYYYSFDNLLNKLLGKEKNFYGMKNKLISFIIKNKKIDKSISIKEIQTKNRVLNLNANEIKNLLENSVIFDEKRENILSLNL